MKNNQKKPTTNNILMISTLIVFIIGLFLYLATKSLIPVVFTMICYAFIFWRYKVLAKQENVEIRSIKPSKNDTKQNRMMISLKRSKTNGN